MKMRAILMLLLLSVHVHAVDVTFTAQQLKAPVFDASGHLIRRLTAAAATGQLDSPRLENGQIEFFALESEKEPMAILSFDQALYRKSDESISGDKSVKLASKTGVISGQGYDARLDAGMLTLESQVKFASDDIRVGGDKAEIHFDPKARKKDEMIREIIFYGHIVAERASTSKVPFDRAETTFARYDAEEQKIYVKTPATIWKQGQSSVVNLASGFIEISLAK